MADHGKKGALWRAVFRSPGILLALAIALAAPFVLPNLFWCHSGAGCPLGQMGKIIVSVMVPIAAVFSIFRSFSMLPPPKTESQEA